MVIVGLPDAVVQESREHVQAADKNAPSAVSRDPLPSWPR
jgi:predicted ATPase with chaperone activity